jgi:hypothetical protein
MDINAVASFMHSNALFVPALSSPEVGLQLDKLRFLYAWPPLSPGYTHNISLELRKANDKWFICQPQHGATGGIEVAPPSTLL